MRRNKRDRNQDFTISCRPSLIRKYSTKTFSGFRRRRGRQFGEFSSNSRIFATAAAAVVDKRKNPSDTHAAVEGADTEHDLTLGVRVEQLPGKHGRGDRRRRS